MKQNNSPIRLILYASLALVGLLLVGAIGCGGEVTLSVPGCEECPERCIRTENKRGKCVQCLKDEQCQSADSPTRKCENQKCICGSDQDCSDGLRCSGNYGCVECLRDEHCTDPDRPACGLDNRCAACKPKSSRACIPKGSDACIKGTQVCKANGSWDECTGYKSCASNERCEDNKCVLDCPPAPCEATETKCTTSASIVPGKYIRCVKNAKGCLEWSTEERACGDKELCKEGKCSTYQCPPAECQLDAMRCVGTSEIRTCIKNANGCLVWGEKQPCPAQTQCRSNLNLCTVCLPGSTTSCYTGPKGTETTQPCKAGTQTCLADGSAYDTCKGQILPQKELCNAKDDDCDGQIDEEYPDKGKACEAGQGSCKQQGKQVCQPDGLGLRCDAVAGKSSPEVCDGKDNDCDGAIDESLTQACYTGPSGTRGKGLCKDGTQTCNAGQWGACTGDTKPTTEVCDGKDNDCDGAIDQALTRACYTGNASTKGVGACKDGVQTCTNGSWGTACTGQVLPKTETCPNNIDDDCNGRIDDCSVQVFSIRSSIDTDNGRIDGKPVTGWNPTTGAFTFTQNVQFPAGFIINVKGSKPLILNVTGDIQIDAIVRLAGKAGQDTNCSTTSAAQGGIAGGGGGHVGGMGGNCATGGGSQPPGGDGKGPSPGKGGTGGGLTSGAGGGAGHGIAGTAGNPSTGGAGGAATGTATTALGGSGGGGGGCGVADFSGVAILFVPGGGGGGGGGTVSMTATGNINIKGSLIADGGDGGDAPRCNSLGLNATGGGGGGGAGGSIYLRAKQQITLATTAFLSAKGGTGKGTGLSVGGNGSFGFIRLEDSDGNVSTPAGRVNPTATFATY